MANQFGVGLFAASVIALAIFYKFEVKDERLIVAAGAGTLIGLLIMFL